MYTPLIKFLGKRSLVNHASKNIGALFELPEHFQPIKPFFKRKLITDEEIEIIN
jgi:hypothetical protein